MKRILVVLIIIVIFMGIPKTVSAAGIKTIDDTSESTIISVKAVFVENTDPNVYKSDITGGTASITTRNGITISISGRQDMFDDDVRLVIREITVEEKDACGWFSSVMKNIGTDILPFDIYFEKAGQRTQLNVKIQITITLPEGYVNPLVCYVSTNGKTSVLTSSVTDGKIIFETDHTSYYVLANAMEPPGDIPQTGDNSPILFYRLLMIFSAGILVLMSVRFRRNKIAEK